MKETLLKPVAWALAAALLASGFFSAYARTQWAVAKVPVVCVRENAGHASELGTQVVMGTPLRVSPSGKMSGWYDVETPDGYRGAVIANSLQTLSEQQFDAWRSSDRLVVTSVDQVYVYSSPEESVRGRVSEAVNGTILRRIGPESARWTRVALPDGREGYIASGAVRSIDEWAKGDFDLGKALDVAYSMMGSPYLWGGTSTKSVDCSGLTKVAWLSQGVILPRNASAQAAVGEHVDAGRPELFKPGDLLFFGNPRTRRVNHVGIYLGDGRFIHCSGRVRVNSLRPCDNDYMKLDLLSVSRLGTSDCWRMSVRESDFYF